MRWLRVLLAQCTHTAMFLKMPPDCFVWADGLHKSPILNGSHSKSPFYLGPMFTEVEHVCSRENLPMIDKHLRPRKPRLRP
jgi:hypothetical protein